MKNKRVKDIMVPLSEYATVSDDGSLRDAVAALKKSQADYDQGKYRHRAILVCNKDNVVVGKVSLISILRALEPKYEGMLSDRGPLHMGFTRKFQKAMFESLKLWQDPMDQLCQKAAEIKVRIGRAQFEAVVHEPKSTLCFVCGPPAMVEEAAPEGPGPSEQIRACNGHTA